MSYQRFFETLKPDSQETAQNFEKRILQKCLFTFTFYTYKPVNPFHFLKKHLNRCTLMGGGGEGFVTRRHTKKAQAFSVLFQITLMQRDRKNKEIFALNLHSSESYMYALQTIQIQVCHKRQKSYSQISTKYLQKQNYTIMSERRQMKQC